jgi:hypothetical protein
MAGQIVRRSRIRVLSREFRDEDGALWSQAVAPGPAGSRCRAPKNRPMAGHSSAT